MIRLAQRIPHFEAVWDLEMLGKHRKTAPNFDGEKLRNFIHFPHERNKQRFPWGVITTHFQMLKDTPMQWIQIWGCWTVEAAKIVVLPIGILLARMLMNYDELMHWCSGYFRAIPPTDHTWMNSTRSDPSGVRRGSAEHQDIGLICLEHGWNMNWTWITITFPHFFLMANSI